MSSNIIFWCVVLFLLIHTATCDDNSMQRSYVPKIARVQLGDDVDEYLGNDKLKCAKINRTTVAVNGSITLKKDIPMSAIINIAGYEKNGNSWSDTAGVNITKSCCDYINTDGMVYPDVLLTSNFPKACPIKAGDYNINKFIIKGDLMPEKYPGPHWKFVVTLYHDMDTKRELMVSTVFIDFEKLKAKSKKGNSKKKN